MGAIALALGLGLFYSKVECSPTDCNGEHEVCQNTLLSYKCTCKDYDRPDDSQACYNFNHWVCQQECNKKNTMESDCIDNEGSYSCVCKKGYNAADFCNSCINGFIEYKVNETYSECVGNVVQ